MAGHRQYCFSFSIFVVLLICVSEATDSTPSQCSPVLLNTPTCLQAVRILLADEDRFWFGNSYSIRCPPFAFNAECINYNSTLKSIATRMRESTDNSVDGIQHVLNVTYDVGAGSYEACGNTYSVPAITHTLDPTKVTPIPLWSANHKPHVSWPSEAGKTYTLMVWDAGAFFLHAMFYNIKGSNIEGGMTGWNYRGPKNPAERDQPYVFLLYEQTADIQQAIVTTAIIQSFNQLNQVSPASLVPTFNLQGPIGVGVLTVQTDPYAIEYMKNNRILNNCPDLLTPKFSALPLSYNVSGVHLKSSLDITFSSPELPVSSCCRDVIYASNKRSPNPMGDGLIDPVFTRFAPHVTVVPSNFFDSFYYMRFYQTLLLLDVTDELSGSSNPNTIVHWQIVNMQAGELAYGETIQSYKQPLPLTGDGQRVFMFLLLRHSTMINVADLSGYTGGLVCNSQTTNRCRFNLNAFMTEQGMSVEGVSWFKSSSDVYSRYEAILQYIQTESQACAGVSGYQDPCPTGESHRVRASVVFVGLASVLIGVVISVLN